jgi:Dolichyl-phosphate-mannose-protein mannosyltransferase
LTKRLWILGLLAIVVLAAALRLHGIRDPIVDHPGWRQGDTAGIARNFARLQFDPMYPQTMYNGPPPNYVELELQIVPFLAAALYKIFGVHVIFGRLIALAFSLGTIVTLAYFARWLFGGAPAGLIASFFYAVFPGSIYYGRTFMPDTAMVFFLTAALFVTTRYLTGTERLSPRELAYAAGLLTLAYLAKPVAVLALVPVAALIVARYLARRPTPVWQISTLLALPLLVLWLYDRRVASYAEWHWASGITQLHVLPALRAAFTGPAAFLAKLQQLRIVFGMLRATMVGPLGLLLSIAAFIAFPWAGARSKALLWGWLAGAMAYAYVVVTVERVDYYLYPFLPLCALAIAGALGRAAAAVWAADVAPAARFALLALIPALAAAVLAQSPAAVAAYYAYNPKAYQNAVTLDRALPPGALVVIGHYGPDIQYYIDRFGWEEDPYLWTPFDEESAIAKGARYFISIEDGRLRRNLELCAWLARFPVIAGPDRWPVYQTDPSLIVPNAESFWRAFRRAERAGAGRAFLDSRGVCVTRANAASSATTR